MRFHSSIGSIGQSVQTLDGEDSDLTAAVVSSSPAWYERLPHLKEHFSRYLVESIKKNNNRNNVQMAEKLGISRKKIYIIN